MEGIAPRELSVSRRDGREGGQPGREEKGKEAAWRGVAGPWTSAASGSETTLLPLMRPPKWFPNRSAIERDAVTPLELFTWPEPELRKD